MTRCFMCSAAALSCSCLVSLGSVEQQCKAVCAPDDMQKRWQTLLLCTTVTPLLLHLFLLSDICAPHPRCVWR